MRIDPGFEQMYQAEYGSVFRAVYLLCGDQAMAEDTTQEAFARALERWRRLEGRSWAAGWVVTTALNVSRRALRGRPDPVAAEKNLRRTRMSFWTCAWQFGPCRRDSKRPSSCTT